MKAMVFAAGLGTRLKPFTLEHPKALAPVGGEPMLRRVILKLKEAGINEIVVNVHHFADQIIDYLHQNHNFGITIHISDETSLLLDTGGGILKARKWLDDSNFIVHNADILTDFDLAPMIENHFNCEADATLLVSDRKTSRYLLFDSVSRMHGWVNVSTGQTKPPTLNASAYTPLAFGGVHILSPKIFGSLENFAQGRQVFSIIDYYVAECPNLRFYGYQPSAPYHWLDIGKPELLEKANRIFTNK